MPVNKAARRSANPFRMLISTAHHIIVLACIAAVSVALAERLVPDLDLKASAAVFLSAAVSSVAGFAFSAIAASMLLHFVSDQREAVQIMLIASIAIQTYSLLFIWRHIRIVPVIQAIAGGIIGLPIGVWLFLAAPSQILKISLAALIMIYCAAAAFIPNYWRLPYNGVGRISVGCLGGLIGPSTAFPGAVPTLWISMTELPKDLQRGFFQPYILVMQVLSLAALSIVLPVYEPLGLSLSFIVPAVLGAHLGLSVFKRLSGPQFTFAVRLFLFVSAIGLVAHAV